MTNKKTTRIIKSKNTVTSIKKQNVEKNVEISYQPVEWLGDRIKLLDQIKLPSREDYLEIKDYLDIVDAIKELKVRGAPAIGVAGAYGLALSGQKIYAANLQEFLKKIHNVALLISGVRPTARNLFWAIDRVERAARKGKTIPRVIELMTEEAIKIHAEEADATKKLSEFGAELIKDGDTVLTHCNTGPLATVGYGTALGAIIYAHQHGKKVKVMADETRPLLQGARLTMWELKKAGVPATLITDSMAGYFMKQGKIDCVIVGADRIAANGDTANKIGTYSLAVLAKEHLIPFYVAAPTSTFDLSMSTGKQIPIEQRSGEEVTHFGKTMITVSGAATVNPAFDVTPHKYITAIITEKGIIRKPFGSLKINHRQLKLI
jgi:methylthioribose-1-phosphate isomerase